MSRIMTNIVGVCQYGGMNVRDVQMGKRHHSRVFVIFFLCIQAFHEELINIKPCCYDISGTQVQKKSPDLETTRLKVGALISYE